MNETQPPSLKFFELLEQADEIAQNINPATKIQRVVHYLRDRKHFVKHYTPRLVSIGPIHHGAKNLELGEKYKRMWTAMYLKRTKQYAQALYQKIASNIEHLKELFAEDIIEVFPDNVLTVMLLVDGCALLQILDKGEVNKPEELKLMGTELDFALHDVLLLENQLPYGLLQLLSHHKNDNMLLETMNKFIQNHHLSPAARNKHSTISSPPLHLLDQLHKLVIDDPPERSKNHEVDVWGLHENKDNITIYRNTQELRAVGIRVKRSHSSRITDIHFNSGWLTAELWLPAIMVHGTAATTFVNLIAYEMCPDFKDCRRFCSFVAFMDSLIDSPDDVKELRSAGVLHNALGSDEEVAMLFNTTSTDTVPDTNIYSHVRLQIEKHLNKTCRTWMARGYHTYFRSPGTIIASYTAFSALVLTFIQTWCSVEQR